MGRQMKEVISTDSCDLITEDMQYQCRQNDLITETDAIEKRDFARFEFKMSFERMPYIAQHSRCMSLLSSDISYFGKVCVNYQKN